MISIRTRLTLTIVVITAAIATVAVWGGLGLLERDVRDDAVTRASTALLASSTSGGGSLFAASEPSNAALPAGSASSTDDALAETLDVLDEIGVFDELVDRFAENGVVVLFAADRGLFSVDVETYATAGVDVDQLGDDDVVLLLSDLREIELAIFDEFATNDATDQPDDDELDDTDDEPGDGDLDEVGRDVETVLVVFADSPDIGLVVDVTDEVTAIDSLRAPLWSAAGVVVLLGAIATWTMTGRALRPVGAITARVEEISVGTLHDRVPEPTANDEIGVLARTMNRMLGRLESSDRRQRQFVSDASHELKTPVAVLRSEADAARRAPESTSLPHLATVVSAEAERLGAVIDDLLYLARRDERDGSDAIAAGPGATSRASEVDIDDVVLSESKRSRGVTVDRGAVSAGRVLGNADDLGRAIGHLLDNAARHAESAIAVGVTIAGESVIVTIDDDGDGVPHADRVRIFERFVRLDDARSRDRGGSGLGLAVVAAIIEAHGGTVRVDDGPLGGARFVIELPAVDD